MMSPTTRQLALLRYIHGYQLANGGASPSYQHCAGRVGIRSKSNVHRLLRGLQERGVVRLRAAPSFAIDVLQPPAIPTIAGAPLYAVPLPMPEH